MSGVMARAPRICRREVYQIGHVTVEVIDDPLTEATFALRPGLAADAVTRRPLFSGFIEPGMADALRRLADRVEQLEEGLG